MVARVEGYRFSHDVRVRFAETDAQGIAHHAAYVVWLEEARIAYLDAHAGGYKSIQAQGIEALTIGVSLDYRRTAGFHDVIRVWTRCAEIRGARFRYEYALQLDGEVIATATTLHATVDRSTHRPVRVPGWFFDAIATCEEWPRS
jgi:acyl-CoA thioester hydrolase